MRTVTMMGFGDSARRGQFEIVGELWSLNDCYAVTYIDAEEPDTLKRGLDFNAVFELHESNYVTRCQPRNPRFIKKTHRQWLATLPPTCPVFMREHDPMIPQSIPFPFADIYEYFKLGPQFFRGTPSYMLAFALMLGIRRIRIIGFDQNDAEHREQRPFFVFWLGIGKGMGCSFDGVLSFLDAPENDEGLADLQPAREQATTKGG